MNDDNIYSVTGGNPAAATSLDMSQHVATEGEIQPDMTRHVATSTATHHDMSRYTLSVEQVVQLFADANVPRSKKTIQRYCTEGHLEYVEVDTERNTKFLIEPLSVERRITQLQQAVAVAEPTEDMSRHDATPLVPPVASRRDMTRQRVAEPERETFKPPQSAGASDHDREMYERLLTVKDEQIASLKQDKQDLQNDKVVLQQQLIETRTQHNREVELLLKSAQENTKSSNVLLNFLHSIWPGDRHAANRELPDAYGRIARDVEDTLSNSTEEQRS